VSIVNHNNNNNNNNNKVLWIYKNEKMRNVNSLGINHKIDDG